MTSSVTWSISMQVLYRKELSFFNKGLFYFKITVTVGGEKDTLFNTIFQN